MRRLLLVDLGLEALGAWSQADGIHRVTSGSAAVRILEDEPVEAFLLVPHPRIAETLRHIQILKDVHPAPIIVIGHRDDAELVRESLLAGASDYIGLEDIEHSTISLAVECAVARENHEAEQSRRVYERHAESLRNDRERLRAALINQISDRLQNPLTIIRLQCRILQSKAPPALTNTVRALDEASTRLDELIGQVTTAFKAEHSDLELEATELDLWVLARDTINEAEFQDRRGDIMAARVADNIRARGDEEGCRRIIRYLLRQALRLTHPGEPVELAVGHDHRGANLNIQFPRGLDPRQADALFDAFSGSEDDERRLDLGMELYVARLLGDHMGARVGLSSNAVGSMFRVTFPRGGTKTQRLTVALVADKARSLAAARDAIRGARLDAKVVAAHTWEAAAPSLPGGRADIVVLDLTADDEADALQQYLESLRPAIHVINAQAVADLQQALHNVRRLVQSAAGASAQAQPSGA